MATSRPVLQALYTLAALAFVLLAFLQAVQAGLAKEQRIERKRLADEADKSIFFIKGQVGEALREADTWILFYGASWCPYTQRFTPKWLKVQQEFEARNYTSSNVHIAKIECSINGDRDSNSHLCEVDDVDAYPTILLFVDGKRVEEYMGQDEVNDVLKYVEAQVVARRKLDETEGKVKPETVNQEKHKQGAEEVDEEETVGEKEGGKGADNKQKPRPVKPSLDIAAGMKKLHGANATNIENNTSAPKEDHKLKGSHSTIDQQKATNATQNAGHASTSEKGIDWSKPSSEQKSSNGTESQKHVPASEKESAEQPPAGQDKVSEKLPAGQHEALGKSPSANDTMEAIESITNRPKAPHQSAHAVSKNAPSRIEDPTPASPLLFLGLVLTFGGVSACLIFFGMKLISQRRSKTYAPVDTSVEYSKFA
ncbi:uncharacterized protein EV422DRAFT_511512 [Fimicolochytrium jonesii]|uniref:uncharacterized protein n=1 Tax=Fimicolochytrium jonesii TaxID=1396493 RepID=UPI0022FE2596|nr:uncharacterized protein EV422DRAFT_511512 [Fimicolochytrium jonesii]KAI8826812.1 hypothetical protein EV422DRAFT_511512 [Fimicolochytrium jonesii]